MNQTILLVILAGAKPVYREKYHSLKKVKNLFEKKSSKGVLLLRQRTACMQPCSAMSSFHCQNTSVKVTVGVS